MEFIEGETLHRWMLRSPKPPLGQVIDVFLQIGRGLAAAHRAGLVHRDVKPENVMLGDDGRVLVLDFGIAREGFVGESVDDADSASPTHTDDASALDPNPDIDDDEFSESPEPEPELEPGVPVAIEEDHTPLARLTRVGAVMGTPAYMSPEQHRGRGVDARSDQFAFCVAMWEALNGDKPYGEGSREKLLARMRTGQLRRFRNREVPRRVVLALRRGLAWSPIDRFDSMEALLESLNPRAHAFERKIWSSLGLGAAAGVVTGVLVTSFVFGMRGPTRSSTSSPAPATDEAQPGHGPASRAHIAELRRALDELALTRADADPGIARVRLELARALAAVGEHEAALAEYERALAAFEQLSSSR
jgi:serine/threonine protein kinase